MKNNLCPICDTSNPELEEQQKIKSQRRVAANIALHLCYVLQIAKGRELVLLLGNGNERNNEDALESWVLEKLHELSEWPVPNGGLKTYVRELEIEIKETLLEFCEGWS